MKVYKNGNRTISIDRDKGTKLRLKAIGENGAYAPEYPENIDLNVSNRCTIGCKYCYINATESGPIFEFNSNLLDILFKDINYPLEVAININEGTHSKAAACMTALWLKSKGFIANGTLNSATTLDESERGCFDWIGISITNINQIRDNNEKTVYHLINKLFNFETLLELEEPIKILVLGYKQVGRGALYNPKKGNLTKELFEKLIEKGFTISFDNLAVKQNPWVRDVKNFNTNFLGDDGQHSFYIDLVSKKAFKSSTALGKDGINIRGYNLKELFDEIKKNNKKGKNMKVKAFTVEAQRVGIAETNSSSTHTVSFQGGGGVSFDEYIKQRYEDGTLLNEENELRLDENGETEFGWQVERYSDPSSVFNYLFIAAEKTQNQVRADSFVESVEYVINQEISGFEKNDNMYSYIDHQSFDEALEVLDLFNQDNKNFESITIITDNDNH